MKVKRYPPPRQRTRATITGTRLLQSGTWQWTNNGVPGALYSAPGSVTMTRKQTIDIVTPGYKQLVAKGYLINNPYSSVSRTLEGGDSGNITVRWVSGSTSAELAVLGFAFRDGCGVSSDSTTPSLPSYSNITGYVQTKALAGVEAASLQTGVAIAEFRETMRMLVSPIRGLTRQVQLAHKRYKAELARGRKAVEKMNATRSKKYRAAINSAYAKGNIDKRTKSWLDRYISSGETLTDVVLGYNLGWKPFLSDIDALLNKIPSLECVERRWSRATRSQEDSFDSTSTKSTAYGTNRIKSATKAKATVRAGVLYRDRFEVSHHFGTRLADIPETVWEAIPFSFLVDYAVNVGDYLGALRAQAYSQNLLFYTSTDVEATVVRSWDAVVSTIQHPGVNNVTGTVQAWLPGTPETLTYKAKSRVPDPFSPTIARVQYSHERPAAQLQNVLSLLTRTLISIR